LQRPEWSNTKWQLNWQQPLYNLSFVAVQASLLTLYNASPKMRVLSPHPKLYPSTQLS
jgi:hypothetical protein